MASSQETSTALTSTGIACHCRKKPKDKEVQQALLDLSVDFNLTQVQDKPTRENNLRDLIFTTSPSLIKSTANAPGISDHDIVVVDSDTRPFYAKQRPRKWFAFSRANWDQLRTDIKDISAEIVRLYRCGSSVQKLWDTLIEDLLTAIDSNIPAKLKTSKHSVPWINREVKRTLRRTCKARLFKKQRKPTIGPLTGAKKNANRNSVRQNGTISTR